MTRVSAGLFDDIKMDKTLLLNLELKRSERRRNLRYRTSAALDPENVPVAKVPEKIQKRFETYGLRFYSWFLGCAFLKSKRISKMKSFLVTSIFKPLYFLKSCPISD